MGVVGVAGVRAGIRFALPGGSATGRYGCGELGRGDVGVAGRVDTGLLVGIRFVTGAPCEAGELWEAGGGCGCDGGDIRLTVVGTDARWGEAAG